MDLLRLKVYTRGYGVAVVQLAGEADIAAVPDLRAALNGTLAPSSPPGSLVLLDLSKLDFCDVVALGVMVVAARKLAERGARLALVAPGRPFLRLLEAASLGGFFEVFPSLLAAETAATARPVRRGAA